METMQFHVPVRLTMNGQSHEIDSVRQALSFLAEWPAARRGPVFACAHNGCMAALDGSMRIDDARKAFESFARITGILDSSSRILPQVVAARAASLAH